MRDRTRKRVDDRSGLSLVLKACPRCLGDLVRQSGEYSDYYACLQCGIEIEPRPSSTAAEGSGRIGAQPPARVPGPAGR
jgi:hypothetical protein